MNMVDSIPSLVIEMIYRGNQFAFEGYQLFFSSQQRFPSKTINNCVLMNLFNSFVEVGVFDFLRFFDKLRIKNSCVAL